MSEKIRNYMGRNFQKARTEDVVSEKTRSYNMAKIRSNGTKFEKNFVDELKNHIDASFELNVKDIKGKPDIVFRTKKICIFLDSDFWHGWQFPRWKHLMKNDFWVDKIEANRDRDKRTTQYLRKNGWRVIRIWEHNINKNMMKEISKIEDLL
jgi:DNA mismatch endonuclease, patch repair protein